MIHIMSQSESIRSTMYQVASIKYQDCTKYHVPCTKTQEEEFRSKCEFPLRYSSLSVRCSTFNKYQDCTKYKVLCTKTLIEQNTSTIANPYLVLGTWYLVHFPTK